MCYFYQMNQHNNWQSFIDYETKKSYFSDIKKRLISDNKKGKTILPDAKNYFKAFELCKLEDVKVVIIGQDPYHTPGVANGLAFSVRKEQKLPPSLHNIFKELKSDMGYKIPTSGNLELWAKQGILLLNATLTVRAHKPGSHQKKGWEIFTDKIISLISEKHEHIVFILWGNFAKQKIKLINEKKHFIIKLHFLKKTSSMNYMTCSSKRKHIFHYI